MYRPEGIQPKEPEGLPKLDYLVYFEDVDKPEGFFINHRSLIARRLARAWYRYSVAITVPVKLSDSPYKDFRQRNGTL